MRAVVLRMRCPVDLLRFLLRLDRKGFLLDSIRGTCRVQAHDLFDEFRLGFGHF